MTIDASRSDLLARLQVVERMVRADLLAQYRADPKLLARAFARLEEEEGSSAGRESWVETFAGRAAVLYILKSLYVRVLEDQGLLTPERIRAGGTYELFRRLFPQLGHAAYLRTVFTDAERALPELFAPTLVEIVQPSETAARAVWDVWQETVAGGVPRFDFRGDLDTRFIGDLYQDLDPEVADRYALRQTPRFIEEFILDRTLDPALVDFGLDDFKMIDPTCGSGHFLLGAFERLFSAWCVRLGGEANERWEAAKRALTAVHGADLNEYACALSRFRLLLAVVRVTGVTDAERLRELHYNVITCDALIPWERILQDTLPGIGRAFAWLAAYGTELERERNAAFFSRAFHVVVGNPPYIKVSDKKKNADYRKAWPRSAGGQYSISAPMTERFVLLPLQGGKSGFIVANSFAKRSFGSGLVEEVFPDVTLDLVIDTSGAFIPGHGTPTVMLFTTKQKANGTGTLVVAGKRGEPDVPPDPSRGMVWLEISTHWASENYDGTWVSVSLVPQSRLVTHPWTFSSSKKLEIKTRLEIFPPLSDFNASMGRSVGINDDAAFLQRYSDESIRKKLVFGTNVRDWALRETEEVIFPYSISGEVLPATYLEKYFWPLRTSLRNRKSFLRDFSKKENWYGYEIVLFSRVLEANGIVCAEISTNSHCVYLSESLLATQTAPVLTLGDADAAMYRDVAAILNSSTLEFWLKQVCFPKGGDKVGDGRTPGEGWEERYVRNGTNVLQAPLPYVPYRDRKYGEERFAIISAIDATLSDLSALDANALLATGNAANLPSLVSDAQARMNLLRERLVALQEELDWSVYGAFSLITDVPLMPTDQDVELARGHRPFEIALARRIECGEEESAWFTRHELEPTTTIPPRYTGAMRAVLESRLALIETDQTIAQLEQPIYKRRWTFEPWETLLVRAATNWLLDTLGEMLRARPRLATADELTTELRIDPKAVVIGQFAKDGKDIDFSDTIARLLAYDSIPDNPARILTPTGLRKLIGTQTAALGSPSEAPRAESFVPGQAVDWKRVWRLQEREDAGHNVPVAVPPPFKNVDYAHPNGWRIRGKFNVANERFIVYDELLPKRYAWGGWTAHERALLSSRASDLVDAQQNAGSTPPTLEDPRRCGTQFSLWDKLDELRRTNDPAYDDIAILAQQCGRACPCDVLERWREKPAKPAKAKNGTATPDKGVPAATSTTWDPALREPIIAAITRSGLDGISIESLMPICAGDRAVTRAIVESLRADGKVEAVGRGRGTRYRTTAQTSLL